MLYVAKYHGQVIGKSIEKSYHDALEWARPVAGLGVEIRRGTLDDMCARPKTSLRGVSAQGPRTLKSIIEERG